MKHNHRWRDRFVEGGFHAFFSKIIEWLYERVRELLLGTAAAAVITAFSWEHLEKHLVNVVLYSIPAALVALALFLLIILRQASKNSTASQSSPAADHIGLPKGFSIRMNGVDRRQYEGAPVHIAKIYLDVDHGLAEQRLRFECSQPLCIGACRFLFHGKGEQQPIKMVAPTADPRCVNVNFSPKQATTAGILYVELAANEPVHLNRIARQEFQHRLSKWLDVD